MQDIDDCKSKIAEYLKDSEINIKIEELDDCIIQLISCWCQSGVEACAIDATLKPMSLRIRIICYLKKKSISGITDLLIQNIEKRIFEGEFLPKACDLEIEARNSPSPRKKKFP